MAHERAAPGRRRRQPSSRSSRSSALRAESASRRWFAGRGVAAGDERVDRQPEADDERRAAEISHRLRARLRGRVLRRALRQDVRCPTRRPLAYAAADDDVAADLEERRRRRRRGRRPGRRRSCPRCSSARSASPRRACESPRSGPTTVADDGDLAGVPGELARRQRRRRVAGDGGVEQEDGEHGRDRRARRRAARDCASGHGRSLSRRRLGVAGRLRARARGSRGRRRGSRASPR